MIESRPTFFRHVQRKTGLWVPAPLRMMSPGYPCCETIPRDSTACGACYFSDGTPLYMDITLNNMANCVCNDCADALNDTTFILTHRLSPCSTCCWYYGAPLCGCTLYLSFGFSVIGGPPVYYYRSCLLQVTYCDGACSIYWRDTVAQADVDCMSITPRSLPTVLNYHYDTDQCDLSNGTMTYNASTGP